MTLPGFQKNGLAFAPLDLGAETYSDLVASTLGAAGSVNDGTDALIAQAAQITAAFAQELPLLDADLADALAALDGFAGILADEPSADVESMAGAVSDFGAWFQGWLTSPGI